MARKQSKGSLSKTSFVCILNHILPVRAPVIIAGIPAVIGIPTGIPAVIIPVAVIITAVLIRSVIGGILKILIFRIAVIAVGIVVILIITVHPGLRRCVLPGIILPLVPVPGIIVIALVSISVVAGTRSAFPYECKNNGQWYDCYYCYQENRKKGFGQGFFRLLLLRRSSRPGNRLCSFRLLVRLLYGHPFLHLLVKFVDRIGFVRSLVAYRPGAILLVLIDDKSAVGLILVNTEGFSSLVILTDKGPHFISDYREIMREFGTMEDFDRLLKEIHKREMRLVLDLVVNHTSDEHPWFEEARKSRHNPYYNYYHWWPAEKGEPPLRLSYFDEEGNAWMYNKSTDSYYLHYFSRKQPDLNWENPEVRQEIFDMMRFWFDKGIDGFRMDSISLIAKDPSFPLIDSKKYPDIFSFYAKEPRLHLYLHEMNRQVLSKYDCMSVGEGSAVMVDDVAKFVDPAREELNMLYHFDAARIRNTTLPDNPESGIDYSLIALKKMFTEWDKAVDKGWPSIYLGNHDQPRMVSRFGSDKDEFRALSAKMLITFLLTMRGTPYWFAGDEIGMRNIRFDRIEDYNDIDTINRYKKAKAEGKDPQAVLDEQKETGRDNARTPFQWDRSPETGFTAGTPWLKVNPDYTWINVADEEKDPTSILNYFKKVVSFRKENPSLIYGSYHLLDAENPQSYTFLRKTGADTYLIMLNFSPKAAISTPGIDMSNAHVLLDNYGDRSHMAPQKDITLRPFEAIVFQLNHPVYESFIDSLDLLE